MADIIPRHPTGAFYPKIVTLKLFRFQLNMRQENGVALHKSCQPKRQMSHAETVFIVNRSQRERGRINRTRALLKMLLVDPYVNDLLLQLQYFGDAEDVAIDDGVVRAFKKFRRCPTSKTESAMRIDGRRRPAVYYAQQSWKKKKLRKFLPQLWSEGKKLFGLSGSLCAFSLGGHRAMVNFTQARGFALQWRR